MMKFVVFVCALLSLVCADYYEEHQMYDGPKHHPIITKYGVPLETPEVREAKMHHHIAHEIAARNKHHDDDDVEEHQRYHGPKHYPILTKHGVPLDTPAVREARIHHQIAHELALRSHQEHHHEGDQEHHQYTQQKYYYPIITKQGVPLDTPEVRKARLQHHIAHEYAKNQHQEYQEYEDDKHHYGDSYNYGGYHNGQEDGQYSYSYQIMHTQPNHHHHRHYSSNYY